MALQPRTVFEVNEYPRADDGNIVLALLKGSARAVSGLIADRQPRRYSMRTPVATIGIRGTSFQVTYCLQSCDLPDGLYVTGGDGTIFVKNAFGEIDLSRGRTAYVATAQTAPRESQVKPVVEISEPMTAQQTTAVGSTTSAELRPGNFIYFEGTGGYIGPLTPVTITSVGVSAAVSGSIFGDASGIVRGIAESASGSASGAGFGSIAGPIKSGDSFTVVLDGAQRPVSITATNTLGDRVSVTALNAPELSSSDGILFWGRWTNTRFFFDAQIPGEGSNAFGSGTFPAGSYLHYMVGIPAASVPVTGSATYTFFGGTGSTSQLGSVGAGVTSGTLTANFGSNSVSTNLSISHGTTFAASGSGTLEPGNRALFVGNGTASGLPFKFDGFFAGTGGAAPPRAGMGWGIDRPGDPIVGTAGFRCSAGC